MYKAKSVDEYIESHIKWSVGFKKLRKLMLDLGLEEAIKWGAPVYMLGKKNVVGLVGFKSFLSLWYYQGALLKDKRGVLINAQEGVTKAQRQIRFRASDQIDLSLIKEYTLEAIDNQKAGRAIKADTKKPLIIPEELKTAFADSLTFKAAFENLALSKRREYADHISLAKRSDTRTHRLNKIIPMIFDGVGLSDKYRN